MSKQAGSLVGPDRLRFDFTHFSPLSPEELETVELLVNEMIWLNTPVTTRLLPRDEALKEGAMALFGEKYEESVRVVSMADFSKELCGGTHVGASGEIGVVKIQSENGVASGVRRIEALAGQRRLCQYSDPVPARAAPCLAAECRQFRGDCRQG